MLRFFRFNDPYRLLFVLLAVIILGIKTEMESSRMSIPEFNGILVGEMIADSKTMYSEVWHSMPPLTALVQGLHDFVFDRSILPRHIVSIILIFIQAAGFGIVLVSNRAFSEANYLPSFVFALLAFFSADSIGLTGEILASTLLLLAVNNLLKEIEFKTQRDETIHSLGFYLGLASLSVFSYIVFFIGTALLLYIFTRVEIRRFGLYLIGFLLPHLIINIWYYWNDTIDLLWANFYLPNFAFRSEALMSARSLLYLSIIPISFFFFSLIMMRRDARLTKYQSQIAQIMFLWQLLALAEIFLNRTRAPQALLVCIPSLTYFISHYFLLIRRKWIAETMLWLFFFGLVAVSSLSVRNKIESIDLSGLYVVERQSAPVTGKKILTLGEELSPYLENKTSAYFLDWKLYQTVFREPDVYQHVLVVADAFDADPPDVVIDPENLFKEILTYIPQIREQYRQVGNVYVRIPDRP